MSSDDTTPEFPARKTDPDSSREVPFQFFGLMSVLTNEIANVARRNLFQSWEDTSELLSLIRSLCPVEPLTVATHDKGMLLAQRYGLSIYDAMIAATALLGGCRILYSEDMHDGLLIEKKLRIRNPFLPPV